MNLGSAVFYTKDVDKIQDFYQNVMGFELNSRQGDRFVSFKFSNGAKLSIRIEKGEREVAGHQTAFITSDDIKADYNRLKEKGANIVTEVEDYDWGAKFDIMDPDNNKVEFIQWKK